LARRGADDIPGRIGHYRAHQLVSVVGVGGLVAVAVEADEQVEENSSCVLFSGLGW
jgi:hypothetical protein